MKRVFDLVVALLLLILLAPVLVAVGFLVWAFLGRPVFFVQQRPGLGGRPFRMIKFRTMADIRDSDGEIAPDAQRLTRLGGFLRRYSLDELPELWNVLRGEMSLVGPRPLLMDYLPYYTDRQARRHEVRPGIAGWAQVNGRNALTWDERFALDVWYVDNRNFRLDLRILWMALGGAFHHEGISAPGHATMPRFENRRDPAP
ncbi:sugar transferase [Bauldia litoralis]|uniref:Sugar transferase involved in LPS biosynthesis (Colanic, teichoic acid) n=1 Tax=Bauldia litoralis TaxID=665467 RepID=A0A1G6CVB2_9HYPH|nr:sugar transferase [Bauldia litoralis]SDB36829.1 Sugar transferase involved in LPS biosynthesis (colanic, teichoic acid) [Bauldia litoralis]